MMSTAESHKVQFYGLFFLNIKDLPDNLTHTFKLFANDEKLLEELGTDRDNDDMQT